LLSLSLHEQGFADAKLGRCIVRSEFSEFSITARLKRLQAAASRRKQLPPRANHDDASEDEHGGDAGGDGEVHGRAKPQCIQSKFRSLP
jgi:hypothetical protein